LAIDCSKYRMTYDLHTHTIYSHGWIKPHGKGTIEENVKAAVNAGLRGIAISDHGPGHIFYGVKRQNISVMRAEIERLKPLYPQIDIYLSVEANLLLSDNNLDLQPDEFGLFDFVLAGYHYGVKNGYCMENFFDNRHLSTKQGHASLMSANTEMTLKALYSNNIKVLTHPGDKGPFDISEIAKACAKTGTLMEISTWHSHLTVEEIKIAKREDVKFIISSDAHTPDRVGSFEGGLERALEAGLDIDRIVNIEEK